jgi:hypothetical protein
MEISSDYDFAGAQHGRRFKSIILTYISTFSHLFSPGDLDDGEQLLSATYDDVA